ncbi:MAG: hypothetical protein AB1634_06040 [Thermodesulfobacteriota bacterium]
MSQPTAVTCAASGLVLELLDLDTGRGWETRVEAMTLASRRLGGLRLNFLRDLSLTGVSVRDQGQERSPAGDEESNSPLAGLVTGVERLAALAPGGGVELVRLQVAVGDSWQLAAGRAQWQSHPRGIRLAGAVHLTAGGSRLDTGEAFIALPAQVLVLRHGFALTRQGQLETGERAIFSPHLERLRKLEQGRDT